jgi:uncharacterized protein YdeI (BOF family)
MKHSVVVVAMVMTVAMGLAVEVTAQDREQQQEETLTALGELRRGEYVVVRGEVTRMRDYDEFVIEDGSGRAEIEVRGGMRRPAFRAGDTVTVRGWVDDDLIDFRREIYAVEIELADGTIIEVRGDDWD